MKRSHLCFLSILALTLSLTGCDSALFSGSKTSTPAPASVSISSQHGNLVAGSTGSATFSVSTANISSGTPGLLGWYTSPAGSSTTTAPTGITASVSALSNNTASITMSATSSVTGGSYYFTVTENSTVSAVTTLTVSNAYQIGDTGPAGGLIFYDAGNSTAGWRYLECAPADQAPSSSTTWGGYGTLIGTTSTAVGSGSANTSAIIARLGSGSYAAMICHSYSLNGFYDWFLPSQQELHLMWQNLKAANLGSFTSAWYFSSSEVDANNAYEWDFFTTDSGEQGPKTANMGCVRAIREF